MTNHESGMSTDEWILLQEQIRRAGGGIRVGGMRPEPPFDPNEPWSELPPLKKVSIAAVWELVDALREAGIPVRGPRPRSAGLFSGGKVNVTLRVPERLQAEAKVIIARHFPDW